MSGRLKLTLAVAAGLCALFIVGAYLVRNAPTISNLERCIRDSDTVSQLRILAEERGLDRISSTYFDNSQETWIAYVSENAAEIQWKEGKHELPENPVIIDMAEFGSFWAYVISEEPVNLRIIASEDGQIFGYLPPQE